MKTTTLLNPFVVGRYVSDYYFCDREKETEFLTKQIMNGKNVALISPRRMGKTGLIRHCFNNEKIKMNSTRFSSTSTPVRRCQSLYIYWAKTSTKC